MSFEPKIFESDETARGDLSVERAPLGEPALPLWDDAAQLELPDDLTALAEQLRDDAMYLAQAHPADATPEQRAAAWAQWQKTATKPRGARLRWWASGVAAAALIGAGWLAWPGGEPASDRPADVAAATAPKVGAELEAAIESPPAVAIGERDEEATDRAVNVIVGSDEIKGPRVVRLPEDSPPRVLSASWQDVSGPEQDAIVELLIGRSGSGVSSESIEF